MLRRPQVYIVHGYRAAPDHHWFPWLKEQIEAAGAAVHILPLPDSQHPRLADWLACLARYAPAPDADSFFVGHSLGCITVLRYLETLRAPIGGMVLVAGFAERIDILPELDSFSGETLATGALIERVARRVVVASQDDPVVPFACSERLATRLAAKLLVEPHGGHFLGADGCHQLEPVRHELQAMLDDRRAARIPVA